MEILSEKMDINTFESNVFNQSSCKNQNHLKFIIGMFATREQYEVWIRRKIGKSHRIIATELGITEEASWKRLNKLYTKVKDRVGLSIDRGNSLSEF